MISGVRVSDTGEYVCRAWNVFGKRETPPAMLTVLGTYSFWRLWSCEIGDQAPLYEK